MWDMPCRHHVFRQSTMFRLVIKEHIGIIRFEELSFLHATEEQGLVQMDAPGPQRFDHAFMGRG